MKEVTRNTLWINFKNGKRDSLSALYQEYADELYSYGMKVFGDDQLVKDCIQEVFIQLIDRRENLIITPTIHSYLFKSLRNKIFEELRSKNRKQEIHLQISLKENIIDKYPEQTIIESEESNRVRILIGKALAKLSDRQREIVYLKYTKGFNYDEIAETLQIDKASARTLLYRTLKTIKDNFGDNSIILMFISGSFMANKKPENKGVKN
jgi:RNA polymerase sigma factor (sigma-70 family)